MVSALVVLGMVSPGLIGATPEALTLISDGKAGCVIVVPEGSMSWEGDDRRLGIWARTLTDPTNDKEEYLKRIQRDSVKDLAHYLEKMTSAPVDIVGKIEDGDERIGIFIGPAAEEVFGQVEFTRPGHHGFRIVADERGVGLYGESEFGTSFAIYELLRDWGCRWFMPSELGEVVPELSEVMVPLQDRIKAPVTEYRGIWDRTGDADFMRRNQLGGWAVSSHHHLERYIEPEQLEANPDWRLHIDGEPVGRLLRWTRQDVADAVADAIIAQLDERYRDSMTLSPGDYVVPTEDPEERKHDPEPRVWEPAAGRWSVSDRLLMLANRVAERVGEKYPDVLFGLLTYVNYSFPPAREPVHPNIIPVLSPIDFNRQHPMTWEDHPNEFWLKEMVQMWGEASERVSFRGYAMNLAEITAPNPFITKWGTDIPILLENNMTFWAPETMGGWESMMPGYILSFRMTFDPSETPEDILNDLWEKFYGPAAEPMGNYWHLMDRAWIDAKEYAGCGFGYLKIFTPGIRAKARENINAALELAGTREQLERIKMVEESLDLLDLFMKMHEDFAKGDFRNLESDLDDWVGSVRHLRRKYSEQYAFDSGLAIRYVENYFGHTYRDANRIHREYARLGNPLAHWKYRHNPEPEEESLEWTAVDYDDSEWPETHTVMDTWSSMGHHNSLTDEASGRSGRMVYRTTARVRALPEGKKAFLWAGAVDGTAKVFVNGNPIPYVVPEDTRNHKAGEILDRSPSSFARPLLFEVSDHLQPGENQITILTERNRLWELGTGGLMSPVVLLREK
jgi:hypothetical protein